MRRSAVPFDLPKGVRPSNGALYLVEPFRDASTWRYRWTRLCRVGDGQAAMYAALSNIQSAPVPAGNFAEHVDTFRAIYLPARPITTRKECGRQLDVIAEAFADFDVDQPDAADIIEFTDQWRDHPGAARHYKSLLSTFFRWAIGKRLRENNPCEHVWIARGERKPLAWTPDTYHAIRDALLTRDRHGNALDAGVMMQCYIDLSYLIYQRATDVRLLERAQIRADAIYFRPTKTRGSSGVELEIEITPEIRAVIDRAAAVSKKMGVVCRYVIHTRSGTAFTRSGIYSAFRRAAQLAGVDGINPKSLRSFAATQAKKQGATMEELQEGLGHTSVTTTEGYVRKHEIRRSKIHLTLPSVSAKKP